MALKIIDWLHLLIGHRWCDVCGELSARGHIWAFLTACNPEGVFLGYYCRACNAGKPEPTEDNLKYLIWD